MDTKQVTDTLQALGEAFDQYKQANDQRLAEIKQNGVASADTATKLQTIEEKLSALDEQRSRLDDLEAKAQKAGGFGGMSDDEAVAEEHKQAFGEFFRKGRDEGLQDLERRALNITTPAEGGHAVPEELDRSVHDLLVEISPFRSVANVVRVGSSDYKKLVNVRGTASGWVGETAARPETASPQLAEIAPPIGEIYANLFATQHMLDDAFFNVEDFISSNLATEFAQKEGAAFILGDGVNKPKGFLTETFTDEVDGVRAFGSLQYVPTGVAGDFAAAPAGGDVLIDVVHQVKAGHRNMGQWLMNKGTMALVRKLRDGDGNYLWRPGIERGMASQLLGFNVVEMEDMPDVAADSFSIAFGNFMAGYSIVDRMGTRMLRDPYTNKPYVTFYVTKRVGGKVIDSEAIKVVKFGVA